MPRYTFCMSLPDDRTSMTRTMELWQQGKLQAVTDPRGPFPLTTEGVRAAWHIAESEHAHGKVVIDLTKTSNE